MAEMTDFLEDELLDHVFRNLAYTAPTNIYVALFTAAPSDTGGGTEVTGGAYARQIMVFGAPSPAGTMANNALETFPTATASWGTVTHFALMDAVTAGNMLMHSALDTSRVVGSGETFEFASGSVTITFA